MADNVEESGGAVQRLGTKVDRISLGWAFGSLTTATVYNAIGLLALTYMTTILGLSGTVAGSILLAAKLYDAVSDPVMGTLSDRTRHRWGQRRPFLLYGTFACGLTFALFFQAPLLTDVGLTVALMTGLLLLQSTGYTVYAVPYLAMSPDIAPNYDARTRLMSYRVFFMTGGIMLTAILGPQIIQLAGDGVAGYRAMGWAIGTVAIAAGLIAFSATSKVPIPKSEAGKHAGQGWSRLLISVLRELQESFVAAFQNKPFLLITVVKLLKLAALASVLSCTPLFFLYVLELPSGMITPFLLSSTISGILTLPFWRMLIGHHGKREMYIFVCVVYAIIMGSWFLWTPSEPEAFFWIRAVTSGMVNTGTLVVVLSMLPDTMDYDRLITGTRREGVYSGVFTTVEKISGAFGPLIIGVLLDVMGFIPTRGEIAEQPESALFAIRFGVSIVPAVLSLLCVPLLLRYDLTAEKLEELRMKAQS